jgi:diketogulonate reductase-like aldo/keto reductase
MPLRPTRPATPPTDASGAAAAVAAKPGPAGAEALLPELRFAHGEDRPALGLGTCGFGVDPARAAAEAAVLREAVAGGWRVFDTAEMYADGGAERVLGQALDGALRAGADAGGVAREALFVVSKVLPQHATADGVERACEASLRRLGLDTIDLYLLHWRGPVPLAETVRGFERLQRRGLIRLWGVSNFDLPDLLELAAVPGGAACAANQVWYSLTQRGPARELLSWQRARQMPLMAYGPLDQGALADHPALRSVAARHAATPAQVALAWLLGQGGVMPIPKAARPLHLRHNLGATRLRLSAQDRAELDRAFPVPPRRQPLAMY